MAAEGIFGGDTKPVATARKMVTIGCKHPNGVVLNLDKYERMSTDPNNLQVLRQDGPATFMLKGYAMPATPKEIRAWQRQPNAADRIEGGYALTQIPADFWEQWLKTHGDFPMLRDRTIIGPHSDMLGKARDMEAVEAMNRPVPESGKDPRAPGVEKDEAA
jgi:hypothetical protein